MPVADELVAVVDAAASRLTGVGASAAAVRRAPGAWSPKEVIGHLIDSAANNHQRFVRAQETDRLTFPGYAQEHWVRSQDYQSADWAGLVTFWQLFNHHLAHVIRHVPEGALVAECRIGQEEPVTLAFLIEDYVVHLRHHLDQIDASLIGS
jgi:hypothetical protein